MKETFYFSHDFNSRSDPKIEEMMMTHGMLGYGIFWGIIEMLAQETERWYLPKQYERISYVLRVDKNVVQDVVEKYGLFIFDKDNFWNKRLDRYFDQRAKKSQKAREAVAKRWDNVKKKNTNVIQTKYDPNTIKERKGKEKKGKDNTLSGFLNSIEFEDFWKIYPKKTAKATAMKEWNGVVDDPEEVLAKFKKAFEWQESDPSCFGVEPKYQPKAQDYIVGERWNDVKPETQAPFKIKTFKSINCT